MKSILTYLRNLGRALLGRPPVDTKGGPGPWRPPQ